MDHQISQFQPNGYTVSDTLALFLLLIIVFTLYLIITNGREGCTHGAAAVQ